ncbi:hypothetical protein CDAR_535831 [Caerostris darwini]|uniref:Uncharacterized protein n=1 Tax=Caerostris darwini TaxID=1538125 RepID=A0AAV4QQB8_9ARAC|nr:hypothetical protein CDAR_535831 [Caerostris darwini]
MDSNAFWPIQKSVKSMPGDIQNPSAYPFNLLLMFTFLIELADTFYFSKGPFSLGLIESFSCADSKQSRFECLIHISRAGEREMIPCAHSGKAAHESESENAILSQTDGKVMSTINNGIPSVIFPGPNVVHPLVMNVRA